MTRDELIKRIKCKIEEISPFDEPESFIAATNNPIYEEVKPVENYIDQTLEEAAHEVIQLLPTYVLRSDVTEITSTATVTNGVGVDMIPNNMCRFINLKADSWYKAVTTPIGQDNELYALQQNHHTRGGLAKPVVALCPDYNSLELYSFPKTDDGESEPYTMRYVGYKDAENYSDDVANFIVYMGAVKVLRIFEQENLAQALEKDMLNKIAFAKK